MGLSPETIAQLKNRTVVEKAKLAEAIQAQRQQIEAETRRQDDIRNCIAAFNSQIEADPELKTGLKATIHGHPRKKDYYSYSGSFTGVVIATDLSKAAMLTGDGIKCFKFTPPFNSNIGEVWQSLESAEPIPLEKSPVTSIFLQSIYPSGASVIQTVESLLSAPSQRK